MDTGLSRHGIFRVERTHDYDVSYPATETDEAVQLHIEANITGVLGAGRKEALEYWNRNVVAEAAVRNASLVAQMIEATPLSPGMEKSHPAYKYLTSLPGYQKDSAADRGSALHAIAEALARGQRPVVPDDGIVRDLATQFYRGFIERYSPRFHPLYIEYMVVSLEYGYAGTGDIAVQIGEDIWVLDTKTSSKPIVEGPRGFPYTDTVHQLAALTFADFMGRPDDPRRYPIPGRESGRRVRYGVVAVTPDDCQLIEYRVTPQAFEAFLGLLKQWRFVKDERDTVKLGIVPGTVKKEDAV